MNNTFLLCIFYVCCLLCPITQCQQLEVSFSKHNAQTQKMPLLITLHGTQPFLDEVAFYLSMMLSCDHLKKTGFAVQIEGLAQKPDSSFFKKTFDRGITLMLILEKEAAGFSWYLYDTAIKKVLCAKQVTFDQLSARYVAEHVADQIWPLLTGQEGFFSTRIACVKEQGPGVRDLCLIPVYAQVTSTQFNKLVDILIKQKRILAPRWNGQDQIPMVFYSEVTDTNIALKAIALDGKIRLISNFNGANLLPHFSAHGDKVVYCLSCEGTTAVYLYQVSEAKPILKKVTQNNGNNISPQLCSNGDIIFCSDFKQKTPQICYWHASTDAVDILTPEGYNTCPSFCEKTKKLAYCKFVHGISQVFIYDFTTQQHEQITFDLPKKQECSWSPCGNYLVFASEYGKKSAIMLLNTITKEITRLTPTAPNYRYPSWSPRFSMPLIVS